MNKEAYILLNKLGLPYPKSLSIDDIIILGKENRFFVRYMTESGKKSENLSGTQIINDKFSYDPTINKNILSIEKVYDCIAGGALFLKNGEIYGEYVEGHIVSLLRRGLCLKRFYITKERKILSLSQAQVWKAKLSNNSYNYEFFDGDTSIYFSKVIEYIKKNIFQFNYDNILLEFMMTNDEIIFCDAKNRDLPFFDKLPLIFSENKVYLKKDVEFISKINLDFLDVDYPLINENIEGVTIIINNSALLSHFITRNLNRNLNIIFINNNV